MKTILQKSASLYVLALTLLIPINLFLLLATMKSLAAGTFFFGNRSDFSWYLVFGLGYVIFIAILGVQTVLHSFHEEEEPALKTMTLLKYGLVPFFILNFLSILTLVLFALVASRGTLIFAWPVVIALLLATSFITWLAMMPGTFYSIRVIRLGCTTDKIHSAWAFWHILLQFIFLIDVLDSMYLLVTKWHRGKIGAILIGGLYLIVIVGIIGFCFSQK